MSNVTFPMDAYLERLDYSGIVTPTEDCLKALHSAQLYTIPFENFDIQLGRGISLEPATLCEKLVNNARGGYCFELNGLFLLALHACGFDARALLARVHVTGEPTGRGHQISFVTIQGREWIADVGFGGVHMPFPIPLELNHPTTHDGQTRRLVEVELFGIMMQDLKEDGWRDLYSFDLGYVCPADIEYGNHFTSTHPSSFFTSARIAAVPNPGGYVSLLNTTLSRVAGETMHVEEISEGEAYLDALKLHFGIELDASYEELAPI